MFSVPDESAADPKTRVCVRFPPSAFPTQIPHPITQQPTMATLALNPPANPIKWCGEFKNRTMGAKLLRPPTPLKSS